VVSLLCGLAYFGLPEWLFGCTPGKLLTRLRVRDARTADRPSLARALLRTAAFYLCLDATTLLVIATGYLGGLGRLLFADDVAWRVVASVVLTAVLPFLSAAVGAAVVASTMRRRNGYRGLHELLSGTRVIRLPAAPPRFRAPARAGWPKQQPLAPGVPARVGGYCVLAPVSRGDDELLLQGEDPGLRRPVWLWLRRGEHALSAARRDTARDARPRWLAGGEQDGWRWDAFVAAAGCPLADLVPRRRRLAWRDALSILEQLAGELEEAEQDGSLPDRLSPEQVWVQASGRVMLLDAPVRPPTLAATPMDLLRQVAAVALEGQPRAAAELTRPIHAPVPWHASELLERVMGAGEPFASLGEARAALAAAHALPEEISRPGRALQVALTFAGLAPGLLWMFAVGPLAMLAAYLVCVVGAAAGELARERVREELRDTEPAAAAPDGERERREKMVRLKRELEEELELVERDREVVLASWSWFVAERLRRFEQRLRDENPYWLRDYLRDDAGEGGLRALLESDDMTAGPSVPAAELREQWWFTEAMLFWPLVWAAWAFLTRGGLSPRLAGIALVGASGRPAARWRCAWRTLLVWLPVALLLLASVWLDVWRVASSRGGWTDDEVRLVGWLAWHLWWGALALVGFYVFAAIVWPNRGLHDRLSGVYPVPR
jgi:hypothetical protein